MKVVHLCLGCFYPDNYTYQENMLPKYHKKMGLDVEVIASLVTFDKNGKETLMEPVEPYLNEYGIKVTRLNYKSNNKIHRKLKMYKGTYEALSKTKADILFIHGCQFWDMKYVVKYVKKNPNCKVYVDNHADFSNSGKNFISKNILHKILWKHTAHIIEPYTTKFYGVLPARVEWLKNMYKLPEKKCELLVMGADDEMIEKKCNKENEISVKKKIGVNDKDFVIVTGGKIDPAKLQTLELMKIVNKIGKDKVKLVIFGSIDKRIKEKFDDLCSENIKYIGWANAEESYKYFNIADLVVFPGRHSVYWEQVAAIGKPMVCKLWEGTTHVNINNNVIFVKEDKDLENVLKNLIFNKEKFNKLKQNASSIKRKMFLYSEISKKSIGMKNDD
jgi:hypothetical protein